MGSKASKAKRPAPAKPKAGIVTRIPQDTVSTPLAQDAVQIPLPDTLPVLLQDTIPTIPHDIINEILDHLASHSDFRSLRACALVSKPWVQPCQRHLFRTAAFTPANAYKWLKTFPVQEASPAHHVRDLRLEIGQVSRIPEQFFECIPWFTDVDRMSFSGYGGVPLGYGRFSPLWGPSCWKLPRSVTSLTIWTGAVTLVQVRDIMAQLPNLDDLALLGLAEEDSRKLPGIGTVLKGRFNGRLMLGGSCADEDIINMLLEIPSGLRFAELDINCTRNLLPSPAVSLAEACGKTLMKLSHTVGLYCPNRDDTFERSFDFSKLPNVQDVTFSFGTNSRGEVNDQPITTVTTEMSDDLRCIEAEIARIEREFEGAVGFAVVPGSKFRVVLDSLNILQYYIC